MPFETTPVRRICRKSLNRDAIVFEREITFEADGHHKRWSIQIPAKQFDSETADMILELQKLNAFFSSSDSPSSKPTDSDFIPSIQEQLVDVDPPVLMISNSQFTMPLSLESTTSVKSPAAPTSTLATRRNKSIVPLQIDDPSMKELYPDVPTAFLGTTATVRTPVTTEKAFDSATSSLNLQDMIVTLRSRCASLVASTPPAVVSQQFIAQQAPPSIGEANEQSDEWAFTHGLATTFSPKPSAHDKRLIEETAAGSSAASDGRISLPPCDPLPPCPLALSLAPRGILKRSKSVRFASAEEALQGPSTANKPVFQTIRPRHSTGSSPTKSLRQSAMIRCAPACTVIPPKSTSPTKLAAPFLGAAGRRNPGYPFHPALSTPPRPRAVSTPTVEKRHTVSSRAKMLHISTPARSALAAPPSQPTSILKPSRPTTLPSSPKKVLPGAVETEKENNRVSVAFQPKKSRFTLDDSIMRRSKDSTKSRVPMPLKSILTRFK